MTVLCRNAFLHELIQQRFLLFVTGKDGIYKCNAVVFGVQLCNFVSTGQQVHTDTTAVCDELEQFHFGPAEAVDRDLRAVATFRQARGVPEHRIAGIEDRGHPHKFQCPAVAEDAEVVEVPVCIRQHEIREDLIFKESAHALLGQAVFRADMDKML